MSLIWAQVFTNHTCLLVQPTFPFSAPRIAECSFPKNANKPPPPVRPLIGPHFWNLSPLLHQVFWFTTEPGLDYVRLCQYWSPKSQFWSPRQHLGCQASCCKDQMSEIYFSGFNEPRHKVVIGYRRLSGLWQLIPICLIYKYVAEISAQPLQSIEQMHFASMSKYAKYTVQFPTWVTL